MENAESRPYFFVYFNIIILLMDYHEICKKVS